MRGALRPVLLRGGVPGAPRVSRQPPRSARLQSTSRPQPAELRPLRTKSCPVCSRQPCPRSQRWNQPVAAVGEGTRTARQRRNDLSRGEGGVDAPHGTDEPRTLRAEPGRLATKGHTSGPCPGPVHMKGQNGKTPRDREPSSGHQGPGEDRGVPRGRPEPLCREGRWRQLWEGTEGLCGAPLWLATTLDFVM